MTVLAEKRAELSQEAHEISGGNYAWGGTPYRLFGDHFWNRWKETKESFVAVDLCSAVPLFAEMFREKRRRDLWGIAKIQSNALAQELSRSHKEGSPLLSFAKQQ